MALSIGAATLGIIAGLIVYRKGLPEKEGWDLNKWSPFRRWAGNQFGYDQAVVSMGVEGGGQVGNALWKGFDAGVIDGIVNGLGWLAMRLSKVYSLIQTGLVRGYALLMLMGVVAILCYIVYAVSTGGAL
jgi:NADH-quinone oxidoreductase subunit L